VIGWIDAGAGASGDMLLGALVDAGVPLAHLEAAVAALPGRAARLTAEPVLRGGVAALRVDVDAGGGPPHRRPADVLTLLAGLPPEVAEPARDAFDRLARAEGRVRRIPPEGVDLCELGAPETVATVVGVCAGVAWLRAQRGLTVLRCGPVEVGAAGTVRSGQGPLPVPVPTVLAVLQETPLVVTGRLPYEACSPTGAALLATLAVECGPLPAVRIAAVGAGAGAHDPEHAANVVRLVLGEPTPLDPVPAGPATDGATLLECTVDDLDPRLWPGVLDALLEGGASEAWLTPVLLPAGRPAYALHALCPPAATEAVRDLIFCHTSAERLREAPVVRHRLAPETAVVDVAGEPVRVRLARHGARLVNVGVDHDDVAAAAVALGLPPKVVLARAVAAAQG
jgi:hypothetical protein